METKKHLILLILKILEAFSDKNNPLTQIAIANQISDVYPCDRKTVGRNIAFLIKIGYPIVKTTRGFYLNAKKFTIEEIEFILNAILIAPRKTKEEKVDIINRLSDILNKIYR